MATSPVPSRRTSILYQNAERDITLIDIPTSIAVAQGFSDTLLSRAPLEEPFADTHGPKSEKALEKHSQYASNPLHGEYKTIAETALAEIGNHVKGSWCHPRKVITQAPRPRKDDMDVDDPERELEARLREWSTDASKGEGDAFDFQKMMAALEAGSDPNATSTDTVAHKWLMSYTPARDAAEETQDRNSVSATEPWKSSFYNPESHTMDLTIAENKSSSGNTSYRFRIPPRSSLFLSDSTHSDAFRASFREITEEFTLPRHFDLIVLDPPWPNRSTKRKGNYEQVGGMPHMMKQLSKMDLENYIEHNGLVGIWITNKDSLRNRVLGPGGLFEKWNVGLIEEWIWVKTTTKGEPMLSMDSMWRKPYEIFFLGRAAPNSWTTMAHAPEIKRRVVAAVPDIHSRKPCLKELLEQLMPNSDDYCALEIFSRHLVSGWTSWGNETLKYNWDKYWVSGDEDMSDSQDASASASDRPEES